MLLVANIEPSLPFGGSKKSIEKRQKEHNVAPGTWMLSLNIVNKIKCVRR